MNLTRPLLFLALLLVLGGCGAPGASYPTPIPPNILPTAIAQTAISINATSFALTPSPVSTPTLTPTLAPTPTITLTPTPLPPAPEARIRIESPGPMSLLASPLPMRLFVMPGETSMVQVALFGENGRLLARELTRVNDLPPPGVNLSLEIPFTLRVAELARLEVSTKDRAGRIEGLYAIRLTLLPMGLSQITPPDPPFERAAVYVPAPDSEIFGGMAVVEGALWPLNDQPVLIELQDEAGRVLMTRQLSLVGDTYIPFATTLPYKVSEPTPARLSILQLDPRFNMPAYVYSLLVTLNP